MEFLAVEERVRLKVFKSETVCDVVCQFTYDFKNLSLNRIPTRDNWLLVTQNLHRNGETYDNYIGESTYPNFMHPYFLS